jgi:hypothetical protein
VTKKGVDATISAEASMAAVVAKHEKGPHEEPGEEPENRQVQSVPPCTVGKISAIIQSTEEEEITGHVVERQRQT